MIQLAHVGLYVFDLEKMGLFYRTVFNMHVVCENFLQEDNLIEDLLKDKSSSVRITKLITDQGKLTGIDDMLELIQINGVQREKLDCMIYQPGCMHLGFRIDNMKKTLEKILENGGVKKSDIHIMSNGNQCCFARDIEGNWLELIERH